MTKPLQYSRFYFLNDVYSAIKFVINTSPIQSSLLICAILISGFVPALSIKLTAIIIDKVASVDAHLISHQIFFLCGLWAGFLFLKDFFDPIVLVLQANIADKVVFRIGQGIISKSNAIEGLEIFESPNFHDTIQLLQSQAHYKPLNLVVTVAALLRDLVVILTCLALLMSTIYWVGLLALFCSYLHFKIFSSIQEKHGKNRCTEAKNLEK